MAVKSYHLKISQEEKDKWAKILEPYYTKKKFNKDQINLKLKRVFEDCETGWNHAPKTLEKRIKFKTGWHCKSHANLTSNVVVRKPIEPPDKIDFNHLSFSKSLKSDEKKWWKMREYEYKEEFEFNNSSDIPLLRQLLVEELLQKRLCDLQLCSVSDMGLSKLLTESQKRLTEMLIKLGITREQRKNVLDNIDGNIAIISIQLDTKLQEIEKFQKKQKEKEIYYQKLKEQRPPNNILPPKEKIMAMVRGEEYEE